MVGQSKLRWGGVGGRELPFDPVTVTNGTKAGVMWRKNPVPRAWKTKDGKWGHGSNHHQTGVGFQPVRVHTPIFDHAPSSHPAVTPRFRGYRPAADLSELRRELQVCEDEGMDQQGTEQSCTGEWGPYNMEIVDMIEIDANLPAGKWVLNWRMDQEESNQSALHSTRLFC